MKIYFSGIGGVGIGPLAEIAHDAGYTVVGSDREESPMTAQLHQKGVMVTIGQDGVFLRAQHEAEPIDWFVYTAALPEDHPELVLARELGIRTAKRDELLAHIIKEKNLKLIAVAGTHGKTTTVGMLVWLAKYFSIPVSYSIGTTLSWGPSGKYVPGSTYLIYECDEFDRNFLHFHPFVSIITSLEYDHPDTYASSEEYFAAFQQFAAQSETVITWREYEAALHSDAIYVDEPHPALRLRGDHNRRNGSLILAAVSQFGLPARYAADGLNKFPGTNRRFEKIGKNLYSDYGHTPAEIAATLQLARELSDDVVLVYQPHQNIRQHHIREQYTDELFAAAKTLYWLPTYLSREHTELEILSPEQLTRSLTRDVIYEELSSSLAAKLVAHQNEGALVLLMGAGSIDAWARTQITTD